MTRSDDKDTRLGRREFLRHLILAGAGTGAGLVLPGALTALAASPALPGSPPDKQDPPGITVRPDDPGITAGPVEYPGMITSLMGYLAAPSRPEVYPGILVLHDLPGMTEHVRDVTRRLAKAGYVALALDLLSRMGGTARVGDPTKLSAPPTLTAAQYLEDMDSSVTYLEARPLVAKSRIGVLGFGLPGGSLAWILLSQNPDLKAGVIFYANLPSSAVIPRITTTAVLAIFGDAEQRDTKELADFDAAMKQAGLAWAYKVESKAGRGFFDDSRDRYVPDAAKDAWGITLDWYAKHLSG